MSEKTKREHLVDDVLKTLDALGHYADRSLVTKQTQHHLSQLRSQLRLMVEDYEAEIDQLRDQLTLDVSVRGQFEGFTGRLLCLNATIKAEKITRVERMSDQPEKPYDPRVRLWRGTTLIYEGAVSLDDFMEISDHANNETAGNYFYVGTSIHLGDA